MVEKTKKGKILHTKHDTFPQIPVTTWVISSS